MSHPVLSRLRPVVARLAVSPLYRASNAAMELFHSNVLAWVFRTHPGACEPLADRFGLDVAASYEVFREHRHLDLVVDGGGTALICENKVTALPDAAQLARYRSALLEADADLADRGAYRLLSLVEPIFDLPEPWSWVRYDELAAAVREVSQQLPAGFDADFLAQYAGVCADLSELVDVGGVVGHEDEPYFLDGATDAELRAAGVRDLVVKVRTVHLVQAVRARADGVPVERYEAGFSNGSPLAAYFTPTTSSAGTKAHLGWQMQGLQMRVAVILTDSDLVGRQPRRREAREAAAAEHLAHWLDGARVAAAFGDAVTASGGTLPFNHYAPDFVYRYRKLVPTVTPTQLVDGLVELTREASELYVAGSHPSA